MNRVALAEIKWNMFAAVDRARLFLLPGTMREFFAFSWDNLPARVQLAFMKGNVR